MNERSARARRRLLRPWNFRLYLWAKLPLAACAGLKLDELDDRSCTVSLPGGWRTQNPFRSMYFAAQSMAAEMSTGAPAVMLVEGAPGSMSMLVRSIHGRFLRRVQGRARFTFDGVADMAAAIERAAQSGESVSFVARTVGRGPDGEPATEFDVEWSFKLRGGS